LPNPSHANQREVLTIFLLEKRRSVLFSFLPDLQVFLLQMENKLIYYNFMTNQRVTEKARPTFHPAPARA
jgi:hypothetical protein